MKLQFARLFRFTALLFLANIAVYAQSTDLLWTRAQEQLHSTNNYSPNEISIHTEFDEMGTDYDTLDSKTKLSKWKDGKPIRKEIAFKETNKDSGLKFLNFDFGFVEIHDKLLDMLIVQKKLESTLNNKDCTLYLTYAKFNDIPVSAKVWIETETAMVLQVDYVFDVPKDPNLKSLSISTIFAPAQDGLWLPKEMHTKAQLLACFHELTMHSRQTFDSWTTKP